MPRKTVFSKYIIFQTALELVAENGISALSARAIAKRLHSSVAPVYSYYPSMERLKRDILNEIRERLTAYIHKAYTENSLLNLGTGIVLFAQEQRMLFKAFFLDSPEYTAEIISNIKNDADEDLKKDSAMAKLVPSARETVIFKTWIIAYGLSTMLVSGALENLTKTEISSKLKELIGEDILAFSTPLKG
jgi:AcrR family transcriptional regulator